MFVCLINYLNIVVCEYVCLCVCVYTWLGKVTEGEESKVHDLREALPLPDNSKQGNDDKK